jgi:predicted transcriptional regulator
MCEVRPGITQKELVERLAIGDEPAGYRLRKLVREGRLLCTKIGRTRHYYPTGPQMPQ